MKMNPLSWEIRVAAKRGATLAKINPQWRLAPEIVDRARHQRDLTGPFIQSLLDEQTVSITSMDSVRIITEVANQKLLVTQVVTAFCKTAAVAHQIVRTSRYRCICRGLIC